jgi:hypothetical protein
VVEKNIVNRYIFVKIVLKKSYKNHQEKVKRLMKKIILAIIILILATGAVLYYGWINVEPGYFAIAHSTITGTVDYPLESGRFNWLWEKLIPGNLYIYMVQKNPERIKIEITQPLPGSDQLQKFGRFNIGVITSIEYIMDFNLAKKLVADGLLVNFRENLTEQLSTRLKEALSNFISMLMTRSSSGDLPIDHAKLERLKDELGKSIVDTVKSNKLQSISYSIAYSELPQPEAYARAVEHYQSYIDTAYTMQQEELRREFEDRRRIAEHDIEIDRWKKYAELISKYPEMLKLFYIEKLEGQIDVLVLPENEMTGFPRFLEHEYLKRLTPQEPFQEKPEVQPTEPEKKEVEPPKPSPLPEIERPKERKWYEQLMFWKRPGKEKKEK